MYNQISKKNIDFFTTILKKKYVLTNKNSIKKYIQEPRKKYLKLSPCILCPKNTKQVSEIMQYSFKNNLAIIPQGGNTGLVGAQVPKLGNEIILSLERLNNDIKISKFTQSLICGAGNTLSKVQIEADKIGLFFPLSLASEGSCQIGGNIASNAGGSGVLKYGNMRNLILGLEVVMANGKIWDGLKVLRKDNTGYDLKHLFIGSEGTLGIITKASLKLYTKPQNINTVFCSINNPKDAINLLYIIQKYSNNQVTAFEIIPQIGIDFVLKHRYKTDFPLNDKSMWYILLELSINNKELIIILKKILEIKLIINAVIAQNKKQANEFWYFRDMLSEVQNMENNSIKHDISIPIADIPYFLDKAATIVKEIIPNARPVPFGHIGDGNLHYNVTQPLNVSKQYFLNKAVILSNKIHELVLTLNGSISGEHGIGQMKFNNMNDIKSKVELNMMQVIKKQFDPKNILNPNKTIPLN